MTRKEIVEYCSLCKNRKMDEEKGLVCALTDDYADFEGECKNFIGDEHEIEIKNLQKRQDNSRAIIYVLCMVIGIIWIPAIFFMITEPFASQMFVLLLSGTGTLAALFSIFWVIRVVKINKTNDMLTIDRIMDCVRKEGYYPERLDEVTVQFKIQGMWYRIYYSESVKLSVYTMLQIPHGDIQLFKEISWDVTQEYFLHRTQIHSFEQGDYIEFCINSFTTSYFDFRQFLPSYVSAINDALDMTRNLYNQRKSDIQQPQQPETGFMNYMPQNITS